jgi:hypothetical protein
VDQTRDALKNAGKENVRVVKKQAVGASIQII